MVQGVTIDVHTASVVVYVQEECTCFVFVIHLKVPSSVKNHFKYFSKFISEFQGDAEYSFKDIFKAQVNPLLTIASS